MTLFPQTRRLKTKIVCTLGPAVESVEAKGSRNNGTKTHAKPIGILRATMLAMGVFDGTETA